MTKYATHYSPKQTPQRQPIPGREAEMVPNHEGAFVFPIDGWKRLDRWLILGADGSTYYQSEKALTIENAQSVKACIAQDGSKVIDRIVEISQSGRAPKNDPAIFALAMCFAFGNPDTKLKAKRAIPKVCRIGTHLAKFVESVTTLRNWSAGLRKGVSEWYTGMDPNRLAYQMIKYQSREGWSHRDILRLAHPSTRSVKHDAIFRWVICHGNLDARQVKRQRGKEAIRHDTYQAIDRTLLPDMIQAFEQAQQPDVTDQALVKLIKDYTLPMEAIPTEKRSKAVYAAVYPGAGLTWIIRNLGNLSKHGILAKGNFDDNKAICDLITNPEGLKRAKVHPIQILSAWLTYQQGHGTRGKGTWEVVSDIGDALDSAFYTAFGNVQPAGVNTVLALDVSPSMGGGVIAGVPGLTPRMGAAAMAMVTYKTEPRCEVLAFHDRLVPIDISRSKRLNDVVDGIERASRGWGGTDCAQPMLWAAMKQVKIGSFIVMTDNETHSGNIHPMQALNVYRQKMGIPAKLSVVGMTSTGFSIADPKDGGSCDFVGFDTAVPNLINAFVRGEV